MNRLEQLARRLERPLLEAKKKEKEQKIKAIKDWKKISRLFHACGQMAEIQVKRLILK